MPPGTDLEALEVPDSAAVLLIGIRYRDFDTGALRPKVWTYAALRVAGRWYLTGSGKVPQDAGWGAVRKWLRDPNREVVWIRTMTEVVQIYPGSAAMPATTHEQAEADGRNPHDPPW